MGRAGEDDHGDYKNVGYASRRRHSAKWQVSADTTNTTGVYQAFPWRFSQAVILCERVRGLVVAYVG